MGLIDEIISKAQKLSKTIVLPETEDERVLKATEKILQQGIAKVVLIGEKDTIEKDAANLNVKIDGAQIVNPKEYEKFDAYVDEFVKLREKKGMTKEKAEQIMGTDPRYFGAMMIHKGDADGMVAGSNSPTADVLRASMQVIGPVPGLKTISSCFVMVTPKKEYGKDGILIFADCAVIPDPTAEQLADIAISSAKTAKAMADIDTPRVALMSFSTKGSASHADVDKVTEAVNILKGKDVDFEFDGELQADASIVQSVGEKKAPGSGVAGKANVLVFPDLGAGNIGYKLVQRFANAEAYGPILQGLKKPVNDLSRGCSVDDIVNVTAITAVAGE